MNQLLLVEDTPSLQMIYASVLRKAGFDALTADTAHQGLTIFKSDAPPVALLDLMLPDRDGLELMEDCLRLRPDAKFIVITANGSINKAVRAMRAGAFEFLVKPFDEQRLLGAVTNAFASLSPDSHPTAISTPSGMGQLVGSSAGMQAIYQKISS
jgi:two-component system repressor protein LuxO